MALLLLGFLGSRTFAQIGPAPIIVVQPLDQLVLEKGSATFLVVATSLTAMSYKWYHIASDGTTNVLASTSNSYTDSKVDSTKDDAGGYFVEVINATGSTFSRVATLTILGVNDIPIALDDTYTTQEDVPLIVPAAGVLTNDVDLYPGALSAALVTDVTHGTLILNADGSFTYTPGTNYNGRDSFTYRPTDGLVNGNDATVTINITPVSDAPVAVNDSTNTLEDVSVSIDVLANDRDPDGDVLTLTGVFTTNGTAIVNGANVLFTPDTNFNGTVVFSYTISDGTYSATGNVTVTVIPVSDGPPVANDDTYTAVEDTALTILKAAGVLANDTDVDGDAMTVVLASNVSNGTLNLNANGSFTYTPNTNFYGTDSFTYSARDAVSTGNVATVTINVTPVNDPPRAVNDSTNTPEDVSVTVKVLLNDSDVEGGPLTITGTSTTNGTAVISGTNVVFTPSTNYNGAVVFSYTISDGTNSATANVTVTVAAVNDAPVANNDTYTTLEDVPLVIPAAGILTNDFDVEGNALTALLVSSVSNGTLNLNTNGSFTYTPSTNFNGSDSFTYRARDAFSTGNVAAVTINVTPVNDPPIAVNDVTNTLEDVSVTVNVRANDSDPEGTTLTVTGTSTTNGTAVISGNKVIFHPSTNYNGTVVFSYTVSDGTNSATANVTVTVIPVNDAPPVANNDSYTTAEDVRLTVAAPGVLSNDTDVDGDLMTAVLVSNVTHGTLVLSTNGSFTYTPTTNYFGSDSFTYRATDGMATGNVATVTINLTPVNDPPIANNDVATGPEDTWIVIDVLSNDSDPEGTLLNFTTINSTNGSVATTATNRNVILFRPSTNYNGVAQFSYTVTDGTNTATATVTVTVTPIYDAPVAINDTTNTLEDTSVTIRPLVNDYNPDRSPLSITNVSTTNGTAAIINGTNILFQAATNFTGAVVLSYTLSDGTNSSTANVTVTVTPVNDAPVSYDDSYTMLEDVTLIIPAGGVLTNDIDVDGNALKVYLVTDVSHGTLTLNTNGGFIYVPGTNYNGTDSFTYFATDGQATGNLATATLIITPLDDPPVAVNDVATVAEDTSATIKVLLNDYDPDGRPLTLTSVFTTNGTATVSGTNVIFKAATNFNGTVFLSYTIFDGLYSATGRVTVTVTAVNDPPVANNDATNTLEDVSVTIKVLANDIDPEGAALSITSTTTTNGSAVVSGTNVVFTPATNFFGTVVFTYKVSDGSKFATGIVTVAVAPVNDAPTANDDSYTTLEDVSLNVPAPGILTNDVDPEGNPFIALLVTNVSHGSLSLSADGSFTYTPDLDYNGVDSFSYRATDGMVTGNIATVTINLTPVNDPLRFVSQQVSTNGCKMVLSGPSASTYVIFTSTDLANWNPISTNYTSIGNLVFTDTGAISHPICFYRAMVAGTDAVLQQNTNISSPSVINVTLGEKGAQSFRNGSSGGASYRVGKIVLHLSRDAIAPNTNLVFSIGTGINSGTIAGSTVNIAPAGITNNTAGSSFQTYEIVYSTPVGPLVAGTTYYLNMSCEAANGKSIYLQYTQNNPYSRGTYYQGGSNDGDDIWFQVWGQ